MAALTLKSNRFGWLLSKLGFHRPVRLDVHPGEAGVAVAGGGICGTGVHAYAHGGRYTPAICGHEWAGTVSACGPGVDGLHEGDRVAIGIAPAARIRSTTSSWIGCCAT